MMKRILIGILACSAVITGSFQAHADEVTPGRWWRNPNIARDIGISEKEMQALDDLFNKNRNALIDLKAGMEKERLKLEDILNKEPLNESAAMAQFKRVDAYREKLSAERFKFILGVRKIIGSERFHTLMGKFEEMRKKRFGDRGQGRWNRGDQ
jgi:Spy/CpxP family protein refolding chaperone